VPKIIDERCELVKLCHINHSGPVFIETLQQLVTFSYIGAGKLLTTL